MVKWFSRGGDEPVVRGRSTHVLSLSEVQKARFPMSRRPNEGYRAGEVDDFVDEVVETLTFYESEIARLTAELDAARPQYPDAGYPLG